MFLFSSNAHKSVYRYLGRVGMSPAHSTVLRYLKKLGRSAKDQLHVIGERAYNSTGDDCPNPEFFYFNFNNINKYVVPRTEIVANRSLLRNGTAATAIILEDVPAGAFKLDTHLARMAAGGRWNLTIEAL